MARPRDRPPAAGLLLAPGAGAGADQPALVALDAAVAATGRRVARMDFPYRLAGRRRPDPAPVLEATVREAASRFADTAGCTTAELVLGGRSMGGRICSQAVAAGLPAAGLVLVSYPLHPPAHPERLRVAHFPSLTVPCLFVSGTRDPYATPDELVGATAAIAGPVRHHWVGGGDHGLRRRDTDVADAVIAWFEASFAPASPPARGGEPPGPRRVRDPAG